MRIHCNTTFGSIRKLQKTVVCKSSLRFNKLCIDDLQIKQNIGLPTGNARRICTQQKYLFSYSNSQPNQKSHYQLNVDSTLLIKKITKSRFLASYRIFSRENSCFPTNHFMETNKKFNNFCVGLDHKKYENATKGVYFTCCLYSAHHGLWEIYYVLTRSQK